MDVPAESNKQNAIAFCELMFNECRPREAAEQFAGDQDIQHNPEVADGNLVVLHCHQEWPGDHDYAGKNIFRFDDDGKIVEHLDVLQVVPERAKHDNGMF